MAGGFGAAPNSLGFGGPAALLAPRLLKKWLPDLDLHQDNRVQSAVCYCYTIGQIGTSGGFCPHDQPGKSRLLYWLSYGGIGARGKSRTFTS